MPEKITGPLGFWMFPILNFIYELIQTQSQQQTKKSAVSASEPAVTNIERMVWTDWRGRERKMEIHREVK